MIVPWDPPASINWPSCISALAAVAGVFAAAVGIRNAHLASETQKKLQERQLQQGLFDKRFAVFQAVEKLAQVVFVSNGDFSAEILNEYTVATGQSQFLFGTSVTEYLGRLKKAAIDLRESVQASGREERTSGESRWTRAKANLSSEQGRLSVEFFELADSQRLKYFEPYLQLVEPTVRVPSRRWWQRRGD